MLGISAPLRCSSPRCPRSRSPSYWSSSVRRSWSRSSLSERSTSSHTAADRSDTHNARADSGHARQRCTSPCNTAHSTGRDAHTAGTAPPPPAARRSRRAYPPRPCLRPAQAASSGCSSQRYRASNRQTDCRPRPFLPGPRWSRHTPRPTDFQHYTNVPEHRDKRRGQIVGTRPTQSTGADRGGARPFVVRLPLGSCVILVAHTPSIVARNPGEPSR